MNQDFFKKPTIQLNNNNSFAQKAKELFYSILWMYGFLFLVTILMKITDFFIYQSTAFSYFETVVNQQNKNFGNYPIYYIIIVAPIIEEIIFRLPLTLKKQHIIIGLSFLGILLIKNVFLKFNELKFISALYFCLFVAAVTVAIKFVNQSFLDKIKDNYYPIYFYSFCIIFGLFHIINFVKIVPANLLIFAPIFTLPQITIGYFAGYNRLTNGFLWGVLLHILYNLPGALILLAHK